MTSNQHRIKPKEESKKDSSSPAEQEKLSAKPQISAKSLDKGAENFSIESIEPLKFTVSEREAHLYDEEPWHAVEKVEETHRGVSQFDALDRGLYTQKLGPILKNENFEEGEIFAAQGEQGQKIILEDQQESERCESGFGAEEKESVGRKSGGGSVPPEKARGSVLGMGWFQGFNLFILGLLFIGLAIFAYFMLGEEPLHEGPPKYVVEEIDGGLMARFNPEIPKEIRENYQYVVPLVTAQEEELLKELPQLDVTEDDEKEGIRLLSLSGGEDVELETQSTAEANVADDELPNLTLFSHTEEEGEETENSSAAEAVALLIERAQAAVAQGNYVGINQDDAYHLYTEALKLDNFNEDARAGLYTIANIYYDNAARALGGGNPESAKQFIAIGRVVMPNHDGLKRLEVEVNSIESQPLSNGMEMFDFQ